MKEIYVYTSRRKGARYSRQAYQSRQAGGKTGQPQATRSGLYFLSLSERARTTAKLLTGKHVETANQANFCALPDGIGQQLAGLSKQRNISFLEAVEQLNNIEAIKTINDHARALNHFIDNLLDQMKPPRDGIGLISRSNYDTRYDSEGRKTKSPPLSGWLCYTRRWIYRAK